MVKLKKADLPMFGDLVHALDMMDRSGQAVREYATALKDSANEQIEAHRLKMQAHLDRKDLRPHVLFKPLPKNTWAVSFNSETYTIGPYTHLDSIDEDEPMFYWANPSGERKPVRSLFQALVAVVQDYCNKGVDDGVQTPSDDGNANEHADTGSNAQVADGTAPPSAAHQSVQS